MKNSAPIVALLALFVGTTAASAATVTFAQFNEMGAGGNIASLTSTATSTTISINHTVQFEYIGLTGYSGLPQGYVPATLTLNATTNAAPQALGPFIYLSSFYGSFSFTYNGLNLLTGTFGPAMGHGGALSGFQTGNAAGLSSTDRMAVQYSSSYLNFVNPVAENFSFSFSSVTPELILNNGRVVNFTSAVSGTFASDPPPVGPNPPTSTPEPSSWGAVLLGVLTLTFFRTRFPGLAAVSR